MLRRRRPATSITVSAEVFIQPRSSWVVGRVKRARLCVMAAWRPSGEIATPRTSPLPLGSRSVLCHRRATASITVTRAFKSASRRAKLLPMKPRPPVMRMEREEKFINYEG